MSALDELFTKIKGLPQKELMKLIRETENHPKWGKKRLWVPNAGGQTLALKSPADELFFGGRPGGGKSALLIGTAISDHTNSIIFRKEYQQIKGLEQEAQKVLGSREGYNAQDHIWRIPGTSKIMEFGSVPNEADVERFQGRAHDLKGFDEICHFSKTKYKYLTLWLRSTDPAQRCRIIAAGNPPTSAEGLWVIEYWGPWLDPNFPDPAQPGELRWPVIASDDSEAEIFFATLEEAIEHAKTLREPPVDENGKILPPRSRTFIPGYLEENPDLAKSGYKSVLAYASKDLKNLAAGTFDVQFQDHPLQVIPTAWIVAAQARWEDKAPARVPMGVIGIDVAAGGPDCSVISRRHDWWFAPLIVIPGKDTPLPSDISSQIMRIRRDAAEIVVDCGGGYGGTVVNDLLVNNGIEAVKHLGNGQARGRSACRTYSFFNRRAEVWWRFREALDPERDGGSLVALPPDTALKADLTAPRFEMSTRGIKIEDKGQLKKRLGRSPDRGDAVVICWSEGQSALERKIRHGGKSLPQFAKMRSGPLSRRR